jgi:hypothetical protein
LSGLVTVLMMRCRWREDILHVNRLDGAERRQLGPAMTVLIGWSWCSGLPTRRMWRGTGDRRRLCGFLPVAACQDVSATAEGIVMTKEEAQAIVSRARPGWHVVEVIETNDESGPSYELTVERDGACRVLLMAAGEEIVGERDRAIGESG